MAIQQTSYNPYATPTFTPPPMGPIIDNPPMGGAAPVVSGTQPVADSVNKINTGINAMDTSIKPADQLNPTELAARAGVPLSQVIPNPVGMGYIVGPPTSGQAPATTGQTGTGTTTTGTGTTGATYSGPPIGGIQRQPDGTYADSAGHTYTMNAQGQFISTSPAGTGAGSGAGVGGSTGGTTGPAAPTPPEFGKYTPAQQQQIEQAGIAAGSQYDPLISQAQREKAQGMAKATVAAGEVGGFMSTQFAGQAAKTPIQGGDFIGMGGQLESTKSAYDLNISQLEVQKQQAITQAKQAMQQYIDTGKQQDFNNAQTAYSDAVTAANNQAALASQKITDLMNLQKLNQTINSPIATADPAIQKSATELITKYPQVMQNLQAAGIDYSTLSYGQLAEAVSKVPQFQADQVRASYGTGNYADYKQAIMNGDLPKGTTYSQFLAQNKASNVFNIGGGGSTPGIPDTTSSFVQGLTPTQKTAYDKLSSLDQSNVSQLINGDVLLSDLVSTRGVQGSADRQRLLAEAKSIDPNFSENANKQRYTFKQQWNNPNGKSYITRSAINTAMGHIADAMSYVDDMQKIDAGVLTMSANRFSNFLSKNKGQGPVIDFNYAVDQLASEIATVYKGGVPDSAEITRNKDSLNAAMSKGGLQELFGVATDLLNSKISSTAREYKNVMGRYPTEPVVDPSLVEQLKAQGINTSSIEKSMTTQGYTVPSATDTGSGSETFVGLAPDGKYYSMPMSQLDAFIAAGGKQM